MDEEGNEKKKEKKEKPFNTIQQTTPLVHTTSHSSMVHHVIVEVARVSRTVAMWALLLML